MQIQIFESAQFGQVRTMAGENGEPWFAGKDVAVALGYKKPQNAIKDHVENEDKTTALIQGSGSRYKTHISFINESGLYSLILSSKLPQAREFKRWVTAEVLPQIRKTGGYIPVAEEDDEKTILCKALMIYKRTAEEKEAIIESQKPMVRFAEAVTASDDSILIRDLAKLITQNGVSIGQTRLFSWMRAHGYLFQRETRPIQKWVEKGLFEIHVTLVDTHHGTKERCTTKVTGKGQRYFVEGFLSGKFTFGNPLHHQR